MQSLYPGKAWSRLVYRAPIPLWRLGLGPVVGRIFLLITTTGRKSGLPRQTVIEYHTLEGRKYAASGFGSESHWYRNLTADPLVTIQTADGVEAMRAVRVTDDEELLAVIEHFKRVDPPAFIDWYLRSFDIEPTEADIVAKKERIHLLRFDPTDEPTPPPLDVDLLWIWPVALLLILMLGLSGRKSKSK